MKEIIVNNNTYLFVEVPDDAYNFWVHMNTLCFKLTEKYGTVELGPSIYSREEMYNSIETKVKIIFTTKDITEEQVESIVYHHVVSGTKYYSNYLPYPSQDFRDVIDNSFKTAKESLQSLIQANGLDITKNYLILLKK